MYSVYTDGVDLLGWNFLTACRHNCSACSLYCSILFQLVPTCFILHQLLPRPQRCLTYLPSSSRSRRRHRRHRPHRYPHHPLLPRPRLHLYLPNPRLPIPHLPHHPPSPAIQYLPLHYRPLLHVPPHHTHRPHSRPPPPPPLTFVNSTTARKTEMTTAKPSTIRLFAKCTIGSKPSHNAKTPNVFFRCPNSFWGCPCTTRFSAQGM